MKKLNLFLCLVFLPFSFWGQNYLKNGSFEYGFNTGWTYDVTSPTSNAQFSLDQSRNVMDGNYALKVYVTSRSANRPNSIVASTTMTAGSDSIYLLHFWARGPERGELFVEVVGSETSGVLYQMHTGKTMFRLPFKVDPKKEDRELEINFYFRDYRTLRVTSTSPNCVTVYDTGATYYLDGVEVLDPHNNQNIDVINTYIWEHKRSGTNTWTAGDNDVSLLLPDGRTIWFFNDSFVGRQNSESNVFPGGTFVRNMVVKQEIDGTLIHTSYPITNQGGQNVFFRIPAGEEHWSGNNVKNFFWVGDAILEDNKVKVYLIEVTELNGDAAGTKNSYIASFSYPALAYLGMEKQAPHCVSFETFFVDDADDKIYLFRTENTGWFENNWVHAARTNLGNLSGNSTNPDDAWEYWNGSSWTVNRTQGDATGGRIMGSGNSSRMLADAAVKLGPDNYAFVAMWPMTPYVDVSFAPAPQGPWTAPKRVYTAPQDSAHWYYMPNIHAQLPNGNYSISFSANFGYCLFFCNACQKQSYTDKYWYRQRYVQLDLLGLSPYTTNRKDCAGVPNGTAYFDACHECVGGTTGKEPCLTGIAKLYSGDNFTGKGIGLDVGDYLLKDLTAMNFQDNSLASIQLKSGYIAELFDADNFSGNSKIITSTSANLDAESFKNKTTSLIIRRPGTDNLSGTYRIQNKESGLYMDIENRSAANKALLVQTGKSESDSQIFDIKYNGKGYYEITNSGSNMNLIPSGFCGDVGASIEQWDGKELNITELGGEISAQYNDTQAGEGVEKLIDGLNTTKYLTNHSSAWVEFRSNNQWVIKRYSLTSANDNILRDPRNWTLQASNDGMNWVTLDSRSGITFSSRYQELFFDIEDNATAYSYYHINMTCRSGSVLQLAEWRLFTETSSEAGFDAQKFIIQDAGDGYFKIISKLSDKVLDIFEGMSSGNSKIFQMFDLKQSSALWKLERTQSGIKSVTGNSKMRLYPNPVENELNLESAGDYTGSNFAIYNIGGIAVYKGIMTGRQIDVSRLNSGYYIIKVFRGGDCWVGNFVKK